MGRLTAMIRGRVSESQQALVSIDIVDDRSLYQSVEVILDTGFTGYLTLPTGLIDRLGLLSVGQRTFELANGDLFEFEAYLASVSWQGSQRDVLVLKSDSAPLLGMTLLWGSRIIIDASADGEVLIEDLSSAQ